MKRTFLLSLGFVILVKKIHKYLEIKSRTKIVGAHHRTLDCLKKHCLKPFFDFIALKKLICSQFCAFAIFAP